jgi:DNA-binding response OmpR family regulator
MQKHSYGSTYRIGEIQFKPNDQVLIFSRYRRVKLTNRETLILSYLLDHPNKAITLSELMAQCLNEHQYDPVVIRKTIQLLSSKLEAADNIEYPYIDCYRFVCECEQKSALSIFSLKRIKRWFNRTPRMSKELAH